MVGGDRPVEDDADAVTAHVVESPGAPHGRQIPVEGTRRPVLRRVRDRVAVAGRGDPSCSPELGGRVRVRLRVREHVELRIREVGFERMTSRPFRIALGVGDRAPAARPFTVAVGHDERRTARHVGPQLARGRREPRRVEDERITIEQPRNRRVDHPVAIAGDHHGTARGLGADDLHRILDREHRDRWRNLEIRRPTERLFVEERVERGLDRLGLAEGLRFADPLRWRHEEAPQVHRPDQPVALELQVVAQRDVAGAHQASHRCDRVGRELAVLDAQVERVQKVRRRGRAVRDELPGDVRAVHQPGCDRVDRVPPAVRGEVRTRELEHAGVVRLRVECGSGVLPVLRDVFGALEVLPVEVPFQSAGRSMITSAPTNAASARARPGWRRATSQAQAAFTPAPSRTADRARRADRPAGAAEREPGIGLGRRSLAARRRTATGCRTGARRPRWPRRRR